MQIDKEKWDRCISSSDNYQIYAFSWYLDIVTPDWGALIIEDYEAVMPLPVKRKFFIKYLIQPLFTQQLGVFGIIKDGYVKRFLQESEKHFKFIHLNMNFLNLSEMDNWYKINNNYTLSLFKSYSELRKNYSESHCKNLRRSIKNNLKFNKTLDYQTISSFIVEELKDHDKNIKASAETLLGKLASILHENCTSEVYEVMYEDTRVAAGIFISYNKHIVCQFIANEQGKKMKALFYLLDQYIILHANQNSILDFSGSNIESIAYFFSGFGATVSHYPSFKSNNLPWYLKLVKK